MKLLEPVFPQLPPTVAPPSFPALELEYWSFSGAWMVEFGASLMFGVWCLVFF